MHAYMPPNISQEVKDIAWKAQLPALQALRAVDRQRKEAAGGHTAVARKLVGFIWAIGQRVQPPAAAAPS